LAVSAIMCSCTTSASSEDNRTFGEPERTVTVVFNGETKVYENVRYCYSGDHLHIELADGTDMYYSPACEWEVEDNR
jgi:hypothetical protein